MRCPQWVARPCGQTGWVPPVAGTWEVALCPHQASSGVGAMHEHGGPRNPEHRPRTQGAVGKLLLITPGWAGAVGEPPPPHQPSVTKAEAPPAPLTGALSARPFSPCRTLEKASSAWPLSGPAGRRGSQGRTKAARSQPSGRMERFSVWIIRPQKACGPFASISWTGHPPSPMAFQDSQGRKFPQAPEAGVSPGETAPATAAAPGQRWLPAPGPQPDAGGDLPRGGGQRAHPR